MEFDRRQLFLLFGVVLVVGSVGVGYEIWDVEYTHHLGDEDYGSLNCSCENAYFHYSNLSARGKQIVDRTIKREKYVVESESRTAPEFHYMTDNGGFGHGIYVVHRNGLNYSIRAYQQNPGLSGVLLTPVVAAIGLVGIVLCILGVRSR